MALQITEHPSGSVTIRRSPLTQWVLIPEEQHELLEALARIHGFSLVDREERRSLTELVKEVQALRSKAYGGTADASIDALTTAEALATAVDLTLELEA